MRKSSWIFFLVFIFASANAAFGAQYYVSSSGSDSASGSSASSAWKSVSKVNSASLSDGDIVYFKRGDTWSGTQLLVQAGVTYDAYGSGALPHITTAGLTGESSPAVRAYNQRGAILRYLKLTSGHESANPYNSVVMVSGGSLSKIEYCEIVSTYSGAVNSIVNGVDDYGCADVQHCTIKVPKGEGIAGNVSNAVYSNNYFECGVTAFKLGDVGATNCIAENNYVRITAEGYWGIFVKATTNYVVRNNIVDVTGAGSSIDGIQLVNGGHPHYGGEVYNNTVIGNGGRYGIYIMSADSPYNFKIENNVIVGFSGAPVRIGLAGSGIPNTYINNNLFYNCGNSNNVLLAEGSTSIERNNIKGVDPKFWQSGSKPSPYWVPNADAGSPLINAGVSDDSDISSYDYSGVARVGTVDIGALEYNGSYSDPGTGSGTEALPAPANLRVISSN